MSQYVVFFKVHPNIRRGVDFDEEEYGYKEEDKDDVKVGWRFL